MQMQYFKVLQNREKKRKANGALVKLEKSEGLIDLNWSKTVSDQNNQTERFDPRSSSLKSSINKSVKKGNSASLGAASISILLRNQTNKFLKKKRTIKKHSIGNFYNSVPLSNLDSKCMNYFVQKSLPVNHWSLGWFLYQSRISNTSFSSGTFLCWRVLTSRKTTSPFCSSLSPRITARGISLTSQCCSWWSSLIFFL